jgi:hypothetical protein
MDISCTQNTETGAFICSVPFGIDGDIEYNTIIQPEGVLIFTILAVMFFAWTFERLFYYTTHRAKKSYYDD